MNLKEISQADNNKPIGKQTVKDLVTTAANWRLIGIVSIGYIVIDLALRTVL